ncbi:hypothetical protein ACHQM5_016156 [Ranunculus cassubicifolius]
MLTLIDVFKYRFVDPLKFIFVVACDGIWQNKKKAPTDYPNMRAIMIDWLVEVAEEYILYGNGMNRQCLQLFGATCTIAP